MPYGNLRDEVFTGAITGVDEPGHFPARSVGVLFHPRQFAVSLRSTRLNATGMGVCGGGRA